jgi:opacity protein-like surface antigen
MNRNIAVIALVLFIPAVALCQNESSKVDVFGGYSFLLRSGVGSGWNAEATYNFNRNFGIVTDFSGNYSRTSVNITGVLPDPVNISSNISYHFFMAGPQAGFHVGRVHPFGHVLFGGSYLHASASVSSPTGSGSGAGGTTAFATGAGIGVDVKVSRTVSLRPFLVDGLFTHFGGGGQAMPRFSTGVVFHF